MLFPNCKSPAALHFILLNVVSVLEVAQQPVRLAPQPVGQREAGATRAAEQTLRGT